MTSFEEKWHAALIVFCAQNRLALLESREQCDAYMMIDKDQMQWIVCPVRAPDADDLAVAALIQRLVLSTGGRALYSEVTCVWHVDLMMCANGHCQCIGHTYNVDVGVYC